MKAYGAGELQAGGMARGYGSRARLDPGESLQDVPALAAGVFRFLLLGYRQLPGTGAPDKICRGCRLQQSAGGIGFCSVRYYIYRRADRRFYFRLNRAGEDGADSGGPGYGRSCCFNVCPGHFSAVAALSFMPFAPALGQGFFLPPLSWVRRISSTEKISARYQRCCLQESVSAALSARGSAAISTISRAVITSLSSSAPSRLPWPVSVSGWPRPGMRTGCGRKDWVSVNYCLMRILENSNLPTLCFRAKKANHSLSFCSGKSAYPSSLSCLNLTAVQFHPGRAVAERNSKSSGCDVEKTSRIVG